MKYVHTFGTGRHKRQADITLLFEYMLFLSCFCYAFARVCLLMPVVTCWERADLFALVCDVYLRSCHFSLGILGQVWYLLVSIPDLCCLSYFAKLVRSV